MGIQGTVHDFPMISATMPSRQGLRGEVGGKTINIGEDGATFVPSVSYNGVISWTNDKNLPNPEPVNVMGPKGDKGERGLQGIQGIQGIQGERGEQGQKGDKGDIGATGANGKDGKDGVNGKDGYTPVRGKDYWTAADQSQIVDDVIAALPVYNGEVISV